MWDWCRKIGRKANELGGKAWQWTKTAAHKTFKGATIVVKGAWEVFQTGGARGHALVESIIEGLNTLPKKWISYGVVSIHGTMSLIRLTLKNTQSRVKRGIYLVVKTTQDLTKYIPLLVVLGVGLELDPSALSLLFAGGVTLSVVRGTMKIIRNKLVNSDRELSRLERITVLTYDNIINPTTSVLARMGQGAVAKEVVAVFIADMLNDEKDASSNWLNLFLIIPASLEALRLILRRTNPDSKIVKVYSSCVVGFGKTFETLGYNAPFLVQITANAQGTAHGDKATVTTQQAIKIFGFSIGAGVINGVVSGYHHYKKISKEQDERMSQPDKIVEIDPETGEELVTFESDSNSSTDLSNDRQSPLILGSMFTPQRGGQSMGTSFSNHAELAQPLLLEEEKESDHSSPESQLSRYSPPPLPSCSYQ